MLSVLKYHLGWLDYTISSICRFLLAFWLFFCLIISAAYSGVMKSQMAVPQLTKTIDTMHDIYESGLPVEMVDYGDLGPLALWRSSDPIVRHIHENRVIKEFSPIVQVRSDGTTPR